MCNRLHNLNRLHSARAGAHQLYATQVGLHQSLVSRPISDGWCTLELGIKRKMCSEPQPAVARSLSKKASCSGREGACFGLSTGLFASAIMDRELLCTPVR